MNLFDSEYSHTRLGKIRDTTELADVLGGARGIMGLEELTLIVAPGSYPVLPSCEYSRY